MTADDGRRENGARMVGRWFLNFLGPALLAGALAGAGAYVGVRVQLARLEERFEERTSAMRDDIRELRQTDERHTKRIDGLDARLQGR